MTATIGAVIQECSWTKQSCIMGCTIFMVYPIRIDFPRIFWEGGMDVWKKKSGWSICAKLVCTPLSDFGSKVCGKKSANELYSQFSIIFVIGLSGKRNIEVLCNPCYHRNACFFARFLGLRAVFCHLDQVMMRIYKSL